MTEWLLLLVVGGGVALAIAWPLLARTATATAASTVTTGADADHETLVVRHRLALEGLRDVEADYRAGSLDSEGHFAQRAEAEERAAGTLAALEAQQAHLTHGPELGPQAGDRRLAGVLGGILAVGLLVGFALPPPVGLGERTVVNQPLADAIAQEEVRQAEIQQLLGRIAADSRDTDAFSALADAYLAGGSADDLQRAAVALQVLISLQPKNASAYRRLITAYITAGDWTDADAALRAYTEIAADDEPDIPFFGGLIALRGNGDLPEALRQFDRFLELAPDDPRAAMIRSLRAEALPGG
jgi:cytochrome c-type biogenesis protein CcmH/NrfG